MQIDGWMDGSGEQRGPQMAWIGLPHSLLYTTYWRQGEALVLMGQCAPEGA